MEFKYAEKLYTKNQIILAVAAMVSIIASFSMQKPFMIVSIGVGIMALAFIGLLEYYDRYNKGLVFGINEQYLTVAFEDVTASFPWSRIAGIEKCRHGINILFDNKKVPILNKMPRFDLFVTELNKRIPQ